MGKAVLNIPSYDAEKRKKKGVLATDHGVGASITAHSTDLPPSDAARNKTTVTQVQDGADKSMVPLKTSKCSDKRSVGSTAAPTDTESVEGDAREPSLVQKNSSAVGASKKRLREGEIGEAAVQKKSRAKGSPVVANVTGDREQETWETIGSPVGKYDFGFSFKCKGKYIGESPLDCTDFLSHIQGSVKYQLPPVEDLVERDAYLEWFHNAVQVCDGLV